MSIKINRNTQIVGSGENGPIKWAMRALMRDLKKVFLNSEESGADICLVKKEQQNPEEFHILVREERLEIHAYDELGFVYGIYEVSRSILGISEFWFWNDQIITAKKEILLSDKYQFKSQAFRVRYRGWFVNDEVLISAWSVNREEEKPWEMVFETLLRLGGNMVIPGTDRNSLKYNRLASEMGLIITHHHAEPLGAEMFARAYPNLNPSYSEHGDKFKKLWGEAIQKQRGQKIIWNLGFRGQGDYPFWENDPAYQSDEARGRLTSRLIGMQYDMVKEVDPKGVCSTNLYGETMELYQKGYLDIPTDVIKIWADNGYGKMVTRRQGNHNPRVCSLPEENGGRHGIYYHVSFYDLQAANHITMLPNPPEFIRGELLKALEAGADDYWIINCSNVKPHVYYLDFIAQMWRTGDIDVEEHRDNYISTYFQNVKEANRKRILLCLKKYPEYALAYGKEADEHAGEQFSNHVARILISQYMKDKSTLAEELKWATDADTLDTQIEWYGSLCHKARDGYRQYKKECEGTACMLTGNTEELFRDSFLLQAEIHYHCFQGAYYVCCGLTEALEGNYQKAFYYTGKAKKEYLVANNSMREREHGKWHGFYHNECLTDIKQTAWVLGGLMTYIRNLGDGPHFYCWQREFLYTENDRRVMLIMNMENHLEDSELFALMEERWG